MRFVTSPVELIIAGTGEDEEQFRKLAAGDSRIRFVGRVADEALAELYAGALAVIFTPLREDLGLVTLEAFASAKPLITCIDSGEPSRMVRQGWSGFVCPPDPAQIGARMDQLARSPEGAGQMGRNGAASVASIRWDRVANTLQTALGLADREAS
jgi:glycosyltransferase involved in cell wall biosynthesis